MWKTERERGGSHTYLITFLIELDSLQVHGRTARGNLSGYYETMESHSAFTS